MIWLKLYTRAPKTRKDVNPSSSLRRKETSDFVFWVFLGYFFYFILFSYIDKVSRADIPTVVMSIGNSVMQNNSPRHREQTIIFVISQVDDLEKTPISGRFQIYRTLTLKESVWAGLIYYAK